MKSVLFASAEMAPFVKSGGLADVCLNLPKEFPADRCDVRVVIPCFSCIPDFCRGYCRSAAVLHLPIPGEDFCEQVEILEACYAGLTVYLLVNDRYFSAPEPYSSDIRADIERYIFFDRAVLQMLEAIHYKPDLIHCHDWPASLIPVFLKSGCPEHPSWQRIRTILTVHNLKFQGIWDIPTLKYLTGLPDRYFGPDGLLDPANSRNANMLKGGLLFSDYITTVGPTYCSEIQTEGFGEGLNKVLSDRHLYMQGILNGIDAGRYNPETDPYLTDNYSADDFLLQKIKNKENFQKKTGLKADRSAFLIGISSRLIDLKGTDLILACLEAMLDGYTQIAISGSGNPNYEAIFRDWAWRYPSQVTVNFYEDEEFSHQLFAACDALLIPSRYTPCGVSQMLAFRYGVVPIAYETGGLKDTITAFHEDTDTGTGFLFAKYHSDDLLHTVNYAKQIYFDKRTLWNHLAERGMRQDFSWKKSMLQYEQLYSSLLNK